MVGTYIARTYITLSPAIILRLRSIDISLLTDKKVNMLRYTKRLVSLSFERRLDSSKCSRASGIPSPLYKKKGCQEAHLLNYSKHIYSSDASHFLRRYHSLCLWYLLCLIPNIRNSGSSSIYLINQVASHIYIFIRLLHIY